MILELWLVGGGYVIIQSVIKATMVALIAIPLQG